MAGAVVGIDLGTTNTVVAVVRGGKALVLADDDGHRLLPSVVSFHPSGDVLVGHGARERRLVDARNTVYSIKRLIGRSWASDEVTKARTRFPFELREGPTHGPLVVARGETYTLPEISAFVLRKAKAIAEKALGESVERAVVTVPASFNDLQRASTKVAAREAGLEVLRILNEPTAAALAYGFGKSGNERIAVYDFGGGTFDLTLLDLSGNVFEVIATAGDSFLGGDDLDVAIADKIAMEVIQRTRFDPRSDVQIMERLRAAAEQIKIALSSQTEITVELKELGYGPGGAPIHLQYSMSRAQLEAVAEPYVDRSFKVCDEALQLARLKVDAFDNVILVGGSTRVPLVRRKVEQHFAKKPMDRLNPDEVVAIGAAIQAAALTGAERRRAQTPTPLLDTNAVKASRIQTLGGTGNKPAQARPAPMAPPPGVTRNTGRLVTPPLNARPPGFPAAPPPMEADHTPVPDPNAYPMIPGMVPLPARPQVTAPLIPQSVQKPRGPSIFDADESQETLPRAPVVSPAFPDHSPEPSTLPRAHAFPDHSPEPIALEHIVPPAPPARPKTQVGVAPPKPLQPASIPPLPASSLPSWSQPRPPSYPPVSNELSGNIPLLIDVTPLTLSVETVGGYVDQIIPRNSPVPCSQTRSFTTSTDNQSVVRLRVCQGEGDAFGANTMLGELELSGLRAARRGEVVIEVTFELDADGILQVRARDLETSRQTEARMRLVGLDNVPRGRAMMPAVL